MEFSSLVIMEINKDTKEFVKELGSYEITDGAEYIKKLYYDGDKVNIIFSTLKDVEDWQYYAIYDTFDEGVFTNEGYDINEIEDEYNPTWNICTDFIEDTQAMESVLKDICTIIKNEMERVFFEVNINEEELKEEYSDIK